MGGRRSFQTSRPLKAPNNPPAVSASRRAPAATPAPGYERLKRAAIMPQSARFAAMERSMPRPRITSIWPSASMMRIAVSSSRPARLRGAAKAGNANVTARNSASVSTANARSRRAPSESRWGSADHASLAARSSVSPVACARVNSPRSRPRRITSTRSDMPRISGRSEEIMSTAPPARANSLVTA